MRQVMIMFVSLVMMCAVGCSSDSGGGTGGAGGFSSGCASHSDCGSLLVCVSGACQSSCPRTYVFTFRSATVAKYKSSGSNWDFGGGAPDPQARLEVDGKVVCSTSTVQDSFDPVWNETCEVELFQTSNVVFALWDMDVSDHDLVGGIDAGAPLEDWIIKGGGISGAAGTSLIESFKIDVSLK